ncbi:PAS domain-containing protein [Aestuariivirga litoralis]|uniref:PAS domain-containing protein n=1 Tax=Aestuariivirga litoralis TaxID=2650924 RepID=UPI0018C7D599|nr:PAS domain-containing protein [Aestuariivirga litoralis]
MLPNDRNDIEQAGIRMIHPGSRQLFRYWEALRAERPCPTRDEIELAKISNILPSITVLDEESRGHWRHRMAGSAVCELLCEQVTGRDALKGFDHSAHDVMVRLLETSIAKLQPAIVRLRLIGQHHVTPAELLVLPVLDTRKNAVQLFSGLFGFNTELIVSGAPLVRRELLSARLIWTEHGTAPASDIAPHLRVIDGGLARSSH